MNGILTFIILILILGLLINIHELGHFIMAKKAKVHIYEFSFGMGPKLFSKKGKDGIDYSIRAFPIGGFVSMAGEVYDDADSSVKKEDLMCNKSWINRLLIIIAGVANNFLLAIFLFFLSSLIWGHTEMKPYIGSVVDGYPAKEVGFEEGDLVLSVNGKNTESWDMFILYINTKNKSDVYDIKVKKTNGEIKDYKISPKTEKKDDGTESRLFGFGASTKEYRGLWSSIKYAFFKFATSIHSMWVVIMSLFTGALSLNALSGPVGIYQVVGESAKYGLQSIVGLTALLSVNLGFINILPIPAFDGGRALFLLIEKIMGRPINQKIENTIHNIFFVLLMILMLLITFNDIIRLFWQIM